MTPGKSPCRSVPRDSELVQTPMATAIPQVRQLAKFQSPWSDLWGLIEVWVIPDARRQVAPTESDVFVRLSSAI